MIASLGHKDSSSESYEIDGDIAFLFTARGLRREVARITRIVVTKVASGRCPQNPFAYR